MARKRMTEAERLARKLELIDGLEQDRAKLKKPYDRRAYADLPDEHREAVKHAEIGVQVLVGNAHAAVHNERVKEFAESHEVDLGDKTTIDKPLKALQDLAATYQASGLAKDEVAAKRMAEAYKNAVLQMEREKLDQQGRS